MEDNKFTFTNMFTSVWGILATIIAIVGLGTGIMTFVFKTFPTVTDLKEKIEAVERQIVSKPEYYKKVNEVEDKATALAQKLEKDNSAIRKELEQEINKFRIEYRSERLRDLLLQLKIIDEKLIINPSDRSLITYREFLINEYKRIQGKLDNSLRELEGTK